MKQPLTIKSPEISFKVGIKRFKESRSSSISCFLLKEEKIEERIDSYKSTNAKRKLEVHPEAFL